jgi:hypothetical protein
LFDGGEAEKNFDVSVDLVESEGFVVNEEPRYYYDTNFLEAEETKRCADCQNEFAPLCGLVVPILVLALIVYCMRDAEAAQTGQKQNGI